MPELTPLVCAVPWRSSVRSQDAQYSSRQPCGSKENFEFLDDVCGLLPSSHHRVLVFMHINTGVESKR